MSIFHKNPSKEQSVEHKDQMQNLTKPLLLSASFIFIVIIGVVFTTYSPQKSKAVIPDSVLNRTKPIIVDHNSVDLFDQIPTEYYNAAKELSMVFIDRSVGGNITDGLDCLSTDMDSAPNYCKRWTNNRWPNYTSPAQTWSREYDRSNWDYFFWPSVNDSDPSDNISCETNASSWNGKADCFLEWAPNNINDYNVLSYQLSYLAVDSSSNIATPGFGYFDTKVHDLEYFEAAHPDKIVVYWTTSLARSIGNQVATDFNNQMRSYAINHNKVLLDSADILSHDPYGNPCYDNRDGVTLDRNGTVIPSDNVNYPAICQNYTTEYDGGHLGAFSAGQIRMAKAMWVLMAQIAGWDPEVELPSINLAPNVDAGTDMALEAPANVTLQGSVSDDGLPNNSLTHTWVQTSGPENITISDPSDLTPNITLTTVGDYVFTLTSSDGELSTFDDVMITIINSNTNQPPIANNQNVQTQINTPLAIGLDYSDTDGTSPYTLDLITQPTNGRLVGSLDQLTYTPNDSFSGADSFTWTVSDSQGNVSNIATVSITVVSSQTDDDNLISYFTFNDSTLSDEIMPCNNCTNHGATVVNGHNGNAYHFDGNSNYLNLGTQKRISGEDTITISVWIKPDFDKTDNSWHYVFTEGNNFSFFYLGQTKTWRTILRLGSGTIRLDTLSDLEWNAGEWHKATITYDGAIAKLYWDGTLQKNLNASGNILEMGSGSWIGRSPVGNNYFSGDIDELKIFNYALTPEEVNNL